MNTKTNLAWESPVVAAEWAKNCSAEELFSKYSVLKTDIRSYLDSAVVLRAIIEGTDNAKKLIIAAFADLNSFFDGLEAWEVVNLGKVSNGHMVAILGNSRTNWYDWLSSKDKIYYHELFKPAALNTEDASAVMALMRNPRMNREVISDIIRGKDELAGVDERNRLWWGIEALKTQEMQDNGKRREDPPTHWLRFAAAGEGMHCAIFYAANSGSQVLQNSYFWDPVLNYYSRAPFRIKYEDWYVIPQELKDAGTEITYATKRHSAFKNILDWAKLHFGAAPASIGDNEKHEKNEGYERHDFESYLIMFTAGVLRESQDSNGQKAHLSKEFKEHDCWGFRAAALHAQFREATDYKSGKRLLRIVDEFLSTHSKDKWMTARAVTLSPRFWEAYKISDVLGIDEFFKKSGYSFDKETNSFFDWHTREIIYPQFRDETEIDDQVNVSHDTKQIYRRIDTMRKEIGQLTSWVCGIGVMVAILFYKVVIK